MSHCIALTNCPNMTVAETLASALVDNSLAACVNILPGVTSIYKWEGERVKEQECTLLIKTREDIYPALEAFIQAQHPYELPEIIAVPIRMGSNGYLSWLDQQLDK